MGRIRCLGAIFLNGGDSAALKMGITAGIYGAILAGLFVLGEINIGGSLNGPFG